MMKKFTLFMFVTLFFGMAFAQTSFLIDYDGYDESEGLTQGYNYQRFIWPLNTNTVADFGNMQWAAVDYDQLIVSDGSTYSTLPSTGSYTVVLDSVLVFYNYAPTKDTMNDVTFSVYDYNDFSRDANGIISEVVNPVLGATPLYTTSYDQTDLTISSSLEQLVVYPNVTLTPGQDFSIYMQNVSDTLDQFSLLAGYNENCGDAELGLLSSAPFNSSCFMNYNVSGAISPNQYNFGPATYTCRSFYTQNWTFIPFVTITADTLAVEAVSNQVFSETCPGSNTTLSAIAFGGSGNYTYAWSPATGLSSTSSQDVIATVGEDHQDYVLTVTDVDSGTVSYDTVTVFSFDVSVVAAGPQDVTLSCGNATNINATATSEGGVTISTISWSGNNANPLQVSTSGQYIVTATNAVGCSASDTVNVSVTGQNNIDFDIPTPLCSEQVVTFTNTSSSINGWNFNWFLLQAGDTVTVAGGNDFIRSFDAPGNYQLYCVGDSSGCEFSDFSLINVADGTVPPCVSTISDLSFQALAIYPNPAKGALNVDFTLNSTDDVELSIYGVDGKIVDARSFTNTKEVATTFNTSELNNGVYILKITTQEGTSTQKFVVAHN